MGIDSGAVSTGRILIVGIGNPDRGDDGFGPLVVRRLVGHVSPNVEIVERAGDMLALIEDWAGRDAVILVDAAAPGAEPGRIYRIDLVQDAVPADLSLSSTHAFGVAQAVGLARALGLLPGRVVAYAVEGASFEPGAPVSPRIATAIDDVVLRVAAELRDLEDAMQREGQHV